MEVVAPLEKDPILSGRLIWSFRHLELENLSTSYDFIHFCFFCVKSFFLVPFFTTMEVVATLENDLILSGMLIQ